MNTELKSTGKRKLHPIVEYHYLPRTLGFLLIGAILATIYSGSTNPVIWSVIIFQCLIWPQLAYLIGRKSSRPVIAEKANMYLEAFVFGCWLIVIDLSLWPAAAFFVGALVNTINTGGFGFFFRSTLFMAAGSVLAWLAADFTFRPDASLATSIASMSFIISYSIIVSFISYIYSKKLGRTSRQLAETNNSLQAARDQLWGEMELAKRIQTTLLPVKPEIKGYEIAAYMLPADEVGGDYYDVINVDGKNWIVIGDVSGHGVPAGLIMMMVQTSIHTILSDSGELKPSVLLSRVNRVISENIRRLEEDKYMTITVFACLESGRMFFSGLHQDIMVYKASEKRVEYVETNGAWIGIIDDIKDIVEDDLISLEIGDVMLVFTDGITEAWRNGSKENSREALSDMFGNERLAEVLKINGDRSPAEIKTAIIEELKGYQTNDDVTLLVAKRTE